MAPAAIGVHLFAPERQLLLFLVSALGIVPLAGAIGRSTERLAHRLGSGIGGILNATFGNAAELIIGVIALRAGHIGMVKASITGSIIGNTLFVLGAAMLLGGLGRPRQTFNARTASVAASMMLLSVAALLLPALFHHAVREPAALLEHLSEAIAVVLLATYLLSLVFTLYTHRELYTEAEEVGEEAPAAGGPWKHLAILLGATILVAVLSESLVASAEHAAAVLRLSDAFIGVMVVAVVGNAAEHVSAVLMAMKDRMNLAITIAVESSRQIALFVAPSLVLLGALLGRPMTLEFSLLEIAAVAVATVILTSIAQDGESNWLEGAMLLAMYLIVGMVFYFLPSE